MGRNGKLGRWGGLIGGWEWGRDLANGNNGGLGIMVIKMGARMAF